MEVYWDHSNISEIILITILLRAKDIIASRKIAAVEELFRAPEQIPKTH